MKRRSILPLIILPLLSFNIAANVKNNDSLSMNLAKNTQNNHDDAIGIILEDHKKIRNIIGQLDKNLDSNIEKSRSLLKELKTLLIKHETMEQKIWYPELEKYDDLKSILDKLKKEEQDANSELNKLDDITDDKEWVSKVKSLIKDVKHHAREEETKLFPKVRKKVNQSSLNQIGDKMKDFRE